MRAELVLPQLERSSGRRCGSCLHYQPAPLPGQGWCRNGELRSEHERALVSRHDYRCVEMLGDDYWEPSRDFDTPARPAAHSVLHHPVLKRPLGYAIMLSFILVFSAVGVFSNKVLSTPVVSGASKSTVAATARQDFWLRDDATSAIPSVVFIQSNSRLELIDSKAGEIIDASLPSPAKWYRLKVIGSGNVGWAYSGWIERQ